MAKSPAHKFGQDLGSLLEDLVLNYILKPQLQQYAKKRNLFLDSQGARLARKGKLVSWTDRYGNTHNLDFVIEANGTRKVQGTPLAFIEAAWRRYTKHSKNKAQEIQGALLPIIELHHTTAPFCGVVLAGEFTAPSLKQLESQKIAVLYIPYQQVVKAFAAVDFNIAFDERTPDAKYKTATDRLHSLKASEKANIRKALARICKSETERFMERLRKTLERYILRIIIIPLFGQAHEYNAVEEALSGLAAIDLKTPSGKLTRIEVLVDYSNGDSIRAAFESSMRVEEFLKGLPGGGAVAKAHVQN